MDGNIEEQIQKQLSNLHLDGRHLEMFIGWGMDLLAAIIILIAGWMIGNWLDRRIEKIHRLDETLRNFLGGLVKYAIMTVALVTVLSQFGVQTASLLAVLGAAGLAIGLALQGTLSNVAAGVMLLILRPFKVGDYIVAGDVQGTVKYLGLFGTELAQADNVYMFAPNGQIWQSEIINYSRNKVRRQDIKVGIDYADDINKAFTIVQKILQDDERILKTEDRPFEVMVETLADFSVNLIIRFWSQTSDYWALKWDITKKVKEAFDAGGISIPYPTQRSLEYVVSTPEHPSKD